MTICTFPGDSSDWQETGPLNLSKKNPVTGVLSNNSKSIHISWEALL